MATPDRAWKVMCLGPGGFHRMAVSDWGESVASPLVCVHGLTRNGRDYDALATALAAEFRVVCPDVVGRGQSDWLRRPQPSAPELPAPYNYHQYAADMTVLLGRLDAEKVDWVGTSMGGLIGMVLASQPGSPLNRLVLNDIGPLVPKVALDRICSYVGLNQQFPDMANLVVHMREIHRPFGPLTDAQWLHLARFNSAEQGDGSVRLLYDPDIGEVMRSEVLEDAGKDVDLWQIWDAIDCPVLVIRGVESDLLRGDTAVEMQRRGPGARGLVSLVEVANVGHAPSLMDLNQIAAVRGWLQETRRH
ncbi:MAG: alpha/beta hydrolase [Alphaproteobacteria bacterium]|nr:alpha/beta hydrolase [Alphaproteobacteria bacterium]